MLDDVVDELPINHERQDVRNFDKLFNATQSKPYPECTMTILAFIVRMLHVKVYKKLSNDVFNMIMAIIKDMLPADCDKSVPWNIYESKKFLRDLGLGQYILEKTALDMTWHKDKRVDDDELRHLADGQEWKDFDERFPDFAAYPRNVRLGMATDGFNPFGNMSTSYSMVLVFMVPYNLPPWKCMKEPFCFMSLLIPGPSAIGRDIDIYLRPLIDELKELWENGDSSSVGLRSKIGYLGARRYLPEHHVWRRSKLYNGKYEDRTRPLELSSREIMEQINLGTYKPFGKHASNKKRKRDEYEKKFNWGKKNIFFDLPYWETLNLRHCLDVMHIGKNICDILVGTIMGTDRKNKDTEKAHEDLEDQGVRKELHQKRRANGSFEKPLAKYTLSPKKREGICHFLKSIKYPDGLLGVLKRFVSNKARSEGSIVEAYFSKECTTFCSMYLDGIDTGFNRGERNDDGGMRALGLVTFTQTTHPFGLIQRVPDVPIDQRDMAHWSVLNNSPKIEPYLEYDKFKVTEKESVLGEDLEEENEHTNVIEEAFNVKANLRYKEWKHNMGSHYWKMKDVDEVDPYQHPY
ncbi:hypothetical protein Vadar_025992 [Vaccinium darrowii]|uniref:Uncharacterized protein n=1 Tax=Vaccinium darrowii TaxID=229202 RepID=A0ACB7YZ19_9ERIC|nr:hypothetical protein Vadar_025992 [Vaccinium darrowii]